MWILPRKINITDENDEVIGLFTITPIDGGFFDTHFIATFIKSENLDTGFGISRKFPRRVRRDEAFIARFVQDALNLL